MEQTNKVVDLHNVLEYYGDINLNILDEVIHLHNATGFTMDDKTFGITNQDLYNIMTYWSKILRG